MKISDRLYALYNEIDPGECVADIGTDHGYVPLMLYRDGISPKVIMSDISSGSLAKARESFALCGIDVPDDWFRVGDGLKTIESGEVDALIIGGLGGNTIISILEEDLVKTCSYGKLVLQPRKDSGSLRYWLCCNGFETIHESLAKEGRYVCEIITAKPVEQYGLQALHDIQPCRYPEGDFRWDFPDIDSGCDRDLLRERIEWRLNNIVRNLRNIAKSRIDASAAESELESERSYLIEMKEALQDP